MFLLFVPYFYQMVVNHLKRTLTYLYMVYFLFLCESILGQSAKEIYILYTNNTNGALENCLCPGKSYGSLEKRTHYFKEWSKDYPNTIYLDAGDFLSATKQTLKDSIAFRIYEMLPYDAIAIGDQELFKGITFFTNLSSNSKLPFLSSNLISPLKNVKSELVIDREGVRIGILSILSEDVFRFYPEDVRSSLKILPIEATLQNRLQDLEDKVDFVILLSHLGIEADRELARKLDGIDLIVGSHSQTVLENPEKVGHTIIVQAGKDGYYVGEIRLSFDAENQLVDFTGRLVPMDIELPSEPIVVEKIIEYNRLMHKKNPSRVERVSPVPEEYKITSTDACASCHEDQFQHWAATSHSTAFQTLKHDHKEKSPECLACHTSGFGRDDGYLNYNITKGLKNVTCTECHFTNANHFSNPNEFRTVPIVETSCKRCHDISNSPSFEFSSYLQKIQHPKKVPAVVLETIENKYEDVFLLETVMEAPSPIVPTTTFSTHVVKNGESLWRIARDYYGSGIKWETIYESNKEIITNPDIIVEGMTLKIPKQ